jgi:DNA-binding IclR family transcriptional regulator
MEHSLVKSAARVIQGTNTLRMHLHIGTLRRLFVSGTGRALLSQMDQAMIRKLAHKHNASSDSQPPLDIPNLLG